jgi:hypothetical protein
LALRRKNLAGPDKPPEKIGYTVQPPTGGGREAIGTERSCFSLGPGRFSLPVSAYSSTLTFAPSAAPQAVLL